MITESEEEMATDTAPPVPAGPPDPPAPAAAGSVPAPAGDTGIMAALMAAVEPARPVTEPGAGARPEGDDPAAKADPDGAVDRSSPVTPARSKHRRTSSAPTPTRPVPGTRRA